MYRLIYAFGNPDSIRVGYASRGHFPWGCGLRKTGLKDYGRGNLSIITGIAPNLRSDSVLQYHGNSFYLGQTFRGYRHD